MHHLTGMSSYLVETRTPRVLLRFAQGVLGGMTLEYSLTLISNRTSALLILEVPFKVFSRMPASLSTIRIWIIVNSMYWILKNSSFSRENYLKIHVWPYRKIFELQMGFERYIGFCFFDEFIATLPEWMKQFFIHRLP